VVNADTGAYDVHADRTSSGMHFERGESELVARIERRIGELVGCPVENGEPLQVLHYTPGAEYKPHHDYFDPAQPGNDQVLAMGGQRIATLVMYLNDVEAGGSTAGDAAVAQRAGDGPHGLVVEDHADAQALARAAHDVDDVARDVLLPPRGVALVARPAQRRRPRHGPDRLDVAGADAAARQPEHAELLVG
jgi:hypothetical protein